MLQVLYITYKLQEKHSNTISMAGRATQVSQAMAWHILILDFYPIYPFTCIMDPGYSLDDADEVIS